MKVQHGKPLSSHSSYLMFSRGLVLCTCTSQMGQYLLVSKYRTMHILQTANHRKRILEMLMSDFI